MMAEERRELMRVAVACVAAFTFIVAGGLTIGASGGPLDRAMWEPEPFAPSPPTYAPGRLDWRMRELERVLLRIPLG